jgi:hypothetical protein
MLCSALLFISDFRHFSTHSVDPVKVRGRSKIAYVTRSVGLLAACLHRFYPTLRILPRINDGILHVRNRISNH